MFELFNPTITFCIGLIFLLFGQYFFWLFAGITWFLFGFNLPYYIPIHNPEANSLITGMFFGFLGLLSAIFCRRFVIIIAGTLAGGLILINVYPIISQNWGYYDWVPAIAVGVIGSMLYDLKSSNFAAIIFSSFFGAVFCVKSYYTGTYISNIVVLVIFILGVSFQSIIFKKRDEVF